MIISAFAALDHAAIEQLICCNKIIPEHQVFQRDIQLRTFLNWSICEVWPKLFGLQMIL
jgi:hypothetical protein